MILRLYHTNHQYSIIKVHNFNLEKINLFFSEYTYILSLLKSVFVISYPCKRVYIGAATVWLGCPIRYTYIASCNPPPRCYNILMQIWFIGRTLASQAGKAGSIPVICFLMRGISIYRSLADYISFRKFKPFLMRCCSTSFLPTFRFVFCIAKIQNCIKISPTHEIEIFYIRYFAW